MECISKSLALAGIGERFRENTKPQIHENHYILDLVLCQSQLSPELFYPSFVTLAVE